MASTQSSSLLTPPAPGAQRAPAGCPKALKFVLEKAVNALPPAYLYKPISGEIFKSIDECKKRLFTYGLS